MSGAALCPCTEGGEEPALVEELGTPSDCRGRGRNWGTAPAAGAVRRLNGGDLDTGAIVGSVYRVLRACLAAF